MSRLLHYFNELKTRCKKTFQIIDELINLFYFKVTNDILSYDIRRVTLHNKQHTLLIISKFILNENLDKKESIEINFTDITFKYIVNY